MLTNVWLTMSCSLLCTRYPCWGIFPPFFKVPSYCWTVWLPLFMVIELFDDLDRFFTVHQKSILGHIPLSSIRLYLGSGTRMDDQCWLFTSRLRHHTLYWGIFSSSCRDFVCTVVWGWMIDVGYLPHDFDIRSYTGTYFPILFQYP